MMRDRFGVARLGKQADYPTDDSSPDKPDTPGQMSGDEGGVCIRATPYVWRAPAAVPRRQWLYGRHFVRKFLSCTIATPGIGKSSLALVEAVAMASGRDLLGVGHRDPLRVWYWNGEDPAEETERRIAAIVLHYGVCAQELVGRLFVDTGREMKIIIASKTRNGVVVSRPVVDGLKAAIRENQIDVLIIDPFVSSHLVTENDNGEIEIVVTEWAQIADGEGSPGCAVDLIHHSRKTGGAEVTVEHGRGAFALIAKSRSARVLNQMTKEEGEKAVVASHRLYFRVENGKANLAPPPDRAEWFHLTSVPLGNGSSPEDSGDHVAVVTPWKWPDPLEGVMVADLLAAQVAASQGGPWRENVQAKDWIGKPIADALRLNIGDAKARAKIKGLLKIWIKSGAFVLVMRKNEKREEKTFVEVGELATDA